MRLANLMCLLQKKMKLIYSKHKSYDIKCDNFILIRDKNRQSLGSIVIQEDSNIRWVTSTKEVVIFSCWELCFELLFQQSKVLNLTIQFLSPNINFDETIHDFCFLTINRKDAQCLFLDIHSLCAIEDEIGTNFLFEFCIQKTDRHHTFAYNLFYDPSKSKKKIYLSCSQKHKFIK